MKNLLAKMFFLLLVIRWQRKDKTMNDERCCAECTRSLKRTDHWHYNGRRFCSEKCRTDYKRKDEGGQNGHALLNLPIEPHSYMVHTLVRGGSPKKITG